MQPFPRTDLAAEAQALRQRSAGDAAALPGVQAEETQRGGFSVTTVHILNDMGAQELCKPIGDYSTVTLEPLLRREDEAFEQAATLLAELLREQLPLSPDAAVFVVGLGNRAITPDAIGPLTVEHVLATRHLRQQLPETFGAFRPVAALAPGVLGTTGIEAAALVQALARDLQADAIIAVDALACAEADRLCRTIQITNTGITPGSGVGNDRSALNRDTLGIPVAALGVPTVIDAGALSENARMEGLFITPRTIDAVVRDFSKLAGYAIDLALHPDLTVADLDMFLS